VPPEPARGVAEAITARGGDAELVLLEGEGHGFRSTAAIVRAAEAEADFLARVWGLGR
jgi:dipeptidyl aminopeptidase/acylaminoacyl peptidase